MLMNGLSNRVKFRVSESHFMNISILVTGVCSVVFGIIWLNNLISAFRYHIRLFSGSFSSLTDKVSGFLPFLTWTTVDVSTVTTFIPFFGVVLIFFNIRRLKKHYPEDWPFFEGYSRLNIALGLIGTIWGIILIGYYPLEQVGIPALMQCLHTAMFSTLAAVVWVMVIMPLVISPWAKRFTKLQEMTEYKTDDTSGEELEVFLKEIQAAGNAMKGSYRDFSVFRQELQKTGESLGIFVESVKESRQAEENWRKAALDGMNSIAAAQQAILQRQDVLAAENAELKEKNQKLEARVVAAESESKKQQNQVEALRNCLR